MLRKCNAIGDIYIKENPKNIKPTTQKQSETSSLRLPLWQEA
jgi:hypothetical protein